MERQFSASTLEEAYELAANALNTSVMNLEVKVIQQPKGGFFGLWKKDAIIIASTINNNPTAKPQKSKQTYTNKNKINIEKVSDKIDNIKATKVKKQEKEDTSEPIKTTPSFKKSEDSSDNFYKNDNRDNYKDSKIVIKKDLEDIVKDVKIKVNSVFKNLCFEIDEIDVGIYNDETIYINFTGADSALLIGKEGYRYKAMSYILFNWIHIKYGIMLRLEIAQFLENQEEAINAYLETIIATIHDTGMAKTKPLDGVLVHIALKQLRDTFPDKYVAIKTNHRGGKYILVNEHRK